MNKPSADTIMARQIESTANLVSGLGEHGLANQLWALAGKLRARHQADCNHDKPQGIRLESRHLWKLAGDLRKRTETKGGDDHLPSGSARD